MTPFLATFTVAVKEKLAPVTNRKTAKTTEPIALLHKDNLPTIYFVAVCLLLILAFGLRVWGSRFGLPFLFHPDEQSVVERAIAILRTGDFNPHWFHYPSLFTYVQAISDMLVFLSIAAKQIENIALPVTASLEYVQYGRVTAAIMGTLTVLVVYEAGRLLFSERVGLLSAALLTFSLLHAIHSHYVTTDVPMTLFTTLSFLMSAFVLRTGRSRYYILAGLTAGLAASTKYNGAMVLVSLIAAHAFIAWRKRMLVDINFVAAFAAFGVGFLMGTPYALLDLPTFLKDFAFEVAHYRSGQPGFEGNDNLLWYIRSVLGGWDSVILLFSVAGAAVGLAKRRVDYCFLLVFPAVYFWWFSNFVVRFERNMVPLTPFMALLGAVFVDWASTQLPTRSLRQGVVGALSTLVLLAVAVAPATIGIVQFDRLLSERHPKAIAADWVNSNLPRGSRIAVEHYGIPIDPDSFELVNVLSVSNYDADWFIQEKFDFVIVSDGVWRRFFMEPDKYPKEVAAYNSVFDRFKLVKAVELKPPSPMLVSYPTVDVYHLPYVRIYQVSEVKK